MAASLAPRDYQVLGALGDVLRTRAHPGDKEEAIAALQRAVALRPDFAPGYSATGQLLGEIGKTDEAIVPLRTALMLRPDVPSNHYDLGAALARLGHKDEAVAAFRGALRLRPDYPEARAAITAVVRNH
jgi:Flp pilus assembly protein TadD